MSATRRCGLRHRCMRLLLLALMIATMTFGLIAPIFSQTTYAIHIQPIADAYVTSLYPNVNYGASSTVRLYRGAGANFIVMKFNLTGVFTSQMPNLRFYLWFYVPAASAGSYCFRIHPYPVNWDEGTITWNNKPATISYTTKLAWYCSPSANVWYYSDVTNYVIGNCLNGVCSFAIALDSADSDSSSINSNYYIDVVLRESSSNRPFLRMEYSALTTVTQTFTVTRTETVTNTQIVTETYTAVELTTTTLFTVIGTATETVTQTVTEYYTETIESTATVTDIIYALAYATTTSTITTTLTNTIIDTQTLTQTITQTDTVWAEPVTVTRTITVTPTVTETITETANATETGELFTGEQFNQIVIAIMAIGLIVSILGVLLKASGGE
ncbi:MAG: DNRLRE domain-containing protein [Candidatus Bathyarchaeia archaeon]